MQVKALHNYLRGAIPLVDSMQVVTRAAGPDEVVLSAPLAPNVNHQDTAFGGSIAALATLACWGWLWTHLRESGADARLVVARSEIDYLKPLTTELIARCGAPAAAELNAFDKRFAGRKRARIVLRASVEDTQGILCARYSGVFVADER
ncbi:MAG: YiiD C-terminal domain-containing protein [Gammaproteobacteria bacterium]